MHQLKISLTLVLAAFAISLSAQGFGIRAGVNFQNINGKDDLGDKLDNSLITGYHAGVNFELPIAPAFYLQPGAIFSTKGSKDEIVILEESFDSKIVLGYLEVPLNLLFKPEIGDGKIILGFGPYYAYALNGKLKGDGDDFDIEFKKEISDDDDDTIFYLRRHDFGANLLVGYEFPMGFFLQLNAQLGLFDISSDYPFLPTDDTKYNNTGFGLSLGYQIN